MRIDIGVLAIALFVLGNRGPAIGEAPQARRVTGTVTRVDRASGHVSVHADDRDVEVQLTPAKVRHLKHGDRIAVWLPGQPEVRSPNWSTLRGDPGPPASAVPPPAGYPVGPGMGPIGAGSPNAGPGSPVGADGAR